MQTMAIHHSSDSKYFAATIGALLFWSTSFAATKLAYGSIPPLTLGALRFIVAAVLLGVYVTAKGSLVRPGRKDLGVIALSGFLGITLFFSLQNIGVSLTSASNAALIVASFPAVTALLEWCIYRVRVTRIQMVGIALSIFGVFILTGGDSGGGENMLLGNILLVATGVAWALYTFATRKTVNRYPPATFAFYQTAFGALFFIPVALFEYEAWQMPTPGALGAMLYLALFCSVAAFLLNNYGLRKLSAGVSVSLMNLVPVFGALFSVAVLDEALSFMQLVGGAVVLAGVWCSVHRAAP